MVREASDLDVRRRNKGKVRKLYVDLDVSQQHPLWVKTKAAFLDGVFTVHARNKNIHLFLVHGKTNVWLNGTPILTVKFSINVSDI